jgi:NAD(P)-dependent dehydrogenase (short-subunit alcohol dehydrogenase family)
MPDADPFSLGGRVAVVTGGTGAIGSALAGVLAAAGAAVGVLARRRDRVEATVAAIGQKGGRAFPLVSDVLDRRQLEQARDVVAGEHGRLDVLVNAAGGNLAEATVPPGRTFFDLPPDALDGVFRLNLFGTLLPCHVFGPLLVPAGEDDGGRCIVNISSMAAERPLSRTVGYGAAKAAVENFTRWLAADCARHYGDGLRVNAIAPGFFVGGQNRSLLLDAGGKPTERGRTIVGRTPAGRFGDPSELATTLLWLCSPASRFVTGAVVPVDGGFSAWSGV